MIRTRITKTPYFSSDAVSLTVCSVVPEALLLWHWHADRRGNRTGHCGALCHGDGRALLTCRCGAGRPLHGAAHLPRHGAALGHGDGLADVARLQHWDGEALLGRQHVAPLAGDVQADLAAHRVALLVGHSAALLGRHVLTVLPEYTKNLLFNFLSSLAAFAMHSLILKAPVAGSKFLNLIVTHLLGNLPCNIFCLRIINKKKLHASKVQQTVQ